MKGSLKTYLLTILVASLVACASGSSSKKVEGSGSGNNNSLPQKGQGFTDPDYDTTIIRITDKTIDNYADTGIENEYSRSDPENSDGTYIILRGNDGNWYLYNATTFALIKQLSDIAGGGEEPEPRWDSSSPNILYYLYATELRSYNINDDTHSTVHDFSNDFPTAAYITTKTEGDASLDRRFWCFMIEDESMNLLAVASYDKNLDAVVGQKTSGFPDGINWVSMDMSGNHCVIGYEDSDGDGDDYTPPVDVFSLDFATNVTLPEGSTGHMDLVLSSDGHDVMVYQNNATDQIAMADLETGLETPLVEIPFSINGDIGLHFSGNCSETPGWVLISTYGSKNPPEGQKHSWMDNLIFLVQLNASPTVTKLAATHAYTSLDFDGEKNYFAEAFAAINKAGTKVYFGSNWEDYTPNYSDTYVVEVK